MAVKSLSLSKCQEPQDPNTIPVLPAAWDDPTSWETLLLEALWDQQLPYYHPCPSYHAADCTSRPGVRFGWEEGDEGLGEGGSQSPI